MTVEELLRRGTRISEDLESVRLQIVRRGVEEFLESGICAVDNPGCQLDNFACSAMRNGDSLRIHGQSRRAHDRLPVKGVHVVSRSLCARWPERRDAS